MSCDPLILRTSLLDLNDAIQLYKMARNHTGTPPLVNRAGIIRCAGKQVWQENGHQRELNISAHVINSGLYTDREIAEVIVLGGHQTRMPINERRDMIDVMSVLKPWIIAPTVLTFQDIIDKLNVTIRAEFLARRTPRSPRWGLGWFGPLLKYDMALRIAYAHFQRTGSATLLPTEVFLTQGAKTGAENLMGIKTPSKMVAAAINPIFATCGLREEEIEDFLCVMHSFLYMGSVLPGQVAEVVCGKYNWLINNRLAIKIKRNHPIARLNILIINNI